MGNSSSFEVLRAASEDPFMTVRAAALLGMLRFDVADAEPIIAAQWADLPASVRMQLARRAGVLGAEALLEVAARDSDRRVREASRIE
jgi:hypothetical protein